MKHYAYFNMSRRTQLTTKYIFQVLAQLSENFIFIYLGLSLFTDSTLVFQPPLIIVTVLAVCAARWVAVFPLSSLINFVIRYRAKRRGGEVADELPYSYQAMLFWAGLRGAVGVALAALLAGDANSAALRATVLLVVVLTVIIFGGTTARMLEILGIRTGVVEEADSDDEFDIESFGGYKPGGFGRRNGSVALDQLGLSRDRGRNGHYASGHAVSPHSANGPRTNMSRKNSSRGDEAERADLLAGSRSPTESDIGSDIDTSDLPPPVRRSPRPRTSPRPGGESDSAFRRPWPSAEAATTPSGSSPAVSARSAIRQLLTADDPSVFFRQLDEDYIKPTLLLDGANGRGGNNGHGPGGGASGGNGGAGPSGL